MRIRLSRHQRDRDLWRRRVAEAADGGPAVCVRQIASSGSATCAAVRLLMVGTSCQDDRWCLANARLSDYVIKTLELIISKLTLIKAQFFALITTAMPKVGHRVGQRLHPSMRTSSGLMTATGSSSS